MTKGLGEIAKPLDLIGGPRRDRTCDPLIKRYGRGPPVLYRTLPYVAFHYGNRYFRGRRLPHITVRYRAYTVQKLYSPRVVMTLGLFFARNVRSTPTSPYFQRAVNTHDYW
jgi:hypothetical protein